MGYRDQGSPPKTSLKRREVFPQIRKAGWGHSTAPCCGKLHPGPSLSQAPLLSLPPAVAEGALVLLAW